MLGDSPGREDAPVIPRIARDDCLGGAGAVDYLPNAPSTGSPLGTRPGTIS
jgi:hypothetical protein